MRGKSRTSILGGEEEESEAITPPRRSCSHPGFPVPRVTGRSRVVSFKFRSVQRALGDVGRRAAPMFDVSMARGGGASPCSVLRLKVSPAFIQARA